MFDRFQSQAVATVEHGATLAAWLTVTVVVAPLVPVERVAVAVRAAPVFAVTDMLKVVALVRVAVNHDWFDDAVHEDWLEVTVAVVLAAAEPGDHEVGDTVIAGISAVTRKAPE